MHIGKKFFSKYPKLAKKIKNFLMFKANSSILKNILFISQLTLKKIDEILAPDYKNICKYIDDQNHRHVVGSLNKHVK